MNDTSWLFSLLVVIYIAESCGWTSRHTLLFRNRSIGQQTPSAGWQWELPGRWFGNPSHGLYLRPLLPPLGTLFHCPIWPASLSPVAALAWVPFAMDRADRPDQSACYIRWDNAAHREDASAPATFSEDNVVCLHQQPLARCATEAQARYVMQTLHRIEQAENRTAREAVINDLWTDAFDTKKLQQRLQQFYQHTRQLRVIANLVFFWVFLVAPLAVAWRGWQVTWLTILLFLAGLMISAAICFVRTQRILQPALRHERWKHALMILLSPPATIRALDSLARDQLIGFHPLAVAHALLPRDRFTDFARKYLLDFRYALPSQLTVPSESRATLQWHMRREAAALRQFLQRQNLAVNQLIAADPPTDKECQSYCPRCQCQYVIPADSSSRCTLCDRRLEPFPTAPA